MTGTCKVSPPSDKTEALVAQLQCVVIKLVQSLAPPLIGSGMGREGGKPTPSVFSDTDVWFLLGCMWGSHNDITGKPKIGGRGEELKWSPTDVERMLRGNGFNPVYVSALVECILQRDKHRLSDVYSPIHMSIHMTIG